ncbi:MAG TPA: DM13 domain-containing protein [bacterium]|jgi:hypothetical protein|nr:DM13 domain-containing protein [bacterium]
MRRRWWIIAVLVVIGAPVAWSLGSPLFINRAVEESFPASSGAEVPAGMTKEQVEATMMAASKETASSEEAMPAAAVALRRGTFAGADSFHKGEGTATVYRVGGALVLRLDPFRVTNGPDLHIILTKSAKPRSRDEVMAGYIEVAKLKGNIGTQNYALPAGLRLDEYNAVVIYCKPFHVVFASADLAAAP